MITNKALNIAKERKRDEFYTRYEDIENEMAYYKDSFRNKVILCNCNDGEESNFYRYFYNNFKKLGLKKLITISYGEEPYKLEVENENVTKIDLESGDFRRNVVALNEADIVVTNPPFSIFREFLQMLVDYKKKFIIVGNLNMIVCKDILPYFTREEFKFGPTLRNKGASFDVPQEYGEENNETKLGFVRWFTNIDVGYKPESIPLTKKFSESDYDKFDYYPAINVNRLKDIPIDYTGEIGVPITYLDRHNPDDFEIVGALKRGTKRDNDFAKPFVNGKEKFARLVIKRVNAHD